MSSSRHKGVRALSGKGLPVGCRFCTRLSFQTQLWTEERCFHLYLWRCAERQTARLFKTLKKTNPSGVIWLSNSLSLLILPSSALRHFCHIRCILPLPFLPFCCFSSLSALTHPAPFHPDQVTCLLMMEVKGYLGLCDALCFRRISEFCFGQS